MAGTKYHYSNATRCLVEFSSVSHIETSSYRLLGYGYGTLGLITLGEDVFLCVITGFSQAAMVRPGETVSRIDNVDFCMFNHVVVHEFFFLTICSLP